MLKFLKSLVKKIITISGSEIRHKFLSAYLNNDKNIKVILSVEEEVKKLQEDKILIKNKLFKKHVKSRHLVENRYFKKYIKRDKKYNIVKVAKGYCDSNQTIKYLKSLKPDFIITFGCSIINKKFINSFKNKIINIHLGLSPYYRGSGTNFFPFLYNELQFLGSTIMIMDKGIDTGKIITQIRPNLEEKDNIHTAGNKIIFETIKTLKKILVSRKKIKPTRIKTKYKTRVFKNKDFNIKSLKKAQTNLNQGIIKNYLRQKKKFEKKYKIIINY